MNKSILLVVVSCLIFSCSNETKVSDTTHFLTSDETLKWVEENKSDMASSSHDGGWGTNKQGGHLRSRWKSKSILYYGCYSTAEAKWDKRCIIIATHTAPLQ